jgi:alanyl-tRNA synthetase
MDTETVISTFVEFFTERGHTVVPDTGLVTPDGDPVLFTSAGMHPLTPYLEGRPHPLGRRLVNLQRCLRTTDLEEVGDERHLTLFQMLGSWSLGDYGSTQSLRWGHELLVDRFGLDPKQLHVTVHESDEESERVWGELGLPVERTRAENWWSNGPTGPCGPDSEIFVWTGDGPPTGTPTTDERWLEIWNHVMMRFRRTEPDGPLSPLEQSSVDTGMGLERMAMVLQGQSSVYGIDVFRPWADTLTGLWGEPSRLVLDHLRSSVVVLGDGVYPTNTGRGYVLRRLIRRALTDLWRHDPTRTLSDLPRELLLDTLDGFTNVNHVERSINVDWVRDVLLGEERRFSSLVRRGRPLVDKLRSRGPLTEDDYFYLHDTHGLPRELVTGLLSDHV